MDYSFLKEAANKDYKEKTFQKMLQRNIQDFTKTGDLISPAEVLKNAKPLSNGLNLLANGPVQQFSVTQFLETSAPQNGQRTSNFTEVIVRRFSVGTSPSKL